MSRPNFRWWAASAALLVLRPVPAEGGEKPWRLQNRSAPPLGEDPRQAFDAEPRWMPEAIGKARRLRLGDGRKVSATRLSDRPRLVRISGLLTDDEVHAVQQAGEAAGFQSATVTDPDGSMRPDEMRTSSSAFVDGDAREAPHIRSVFHLAADLAGFPYTWVEDIASLQVLRYHVGEYYAVHYDSKPLAYYPQCQEAWSSAEQASGWVGDAWDAWAAVGADCPRFVTLYLYLNDVPDGGETCFPLADDAEHLGFSHKKIFDISMAPGFVANYSMRCVSEEHNNVIMAAPRRGDALLWYNHLPGEPGSGAGVGERDGLAPHMAMMPTQEKAMKYGANLWLVAPWWGELPGHRKRRRRRRRKSSGRDEL